MRVVENFTKTITREDIQCKYSYRLTEVDFYGTRAYGIEVEREDYINNVLVNIERDFVEKISCYIEKVKNLTNMLYVYEVSPIHLIDIIGEYVDEYVQDFNKCA